ncbi:MAG: ABC transporter ATP-binding protein [Clostridia bacterium]|nr:ABC transporter ATP-binding protein [Clostridia bacterium]MCI1999256.1 ABC transporter ATP-binding protein [Clostridia bacterium]MCI2014791.1 ABC transporter ATP-binding protein [Clostridia bacterium]
MIEIKHLVKNYGKYQAVNDISFKVETGEVLGFLGPNGAGKSTTMNIITGYISATSGEVLIDGFDILKNPKEAKKRIGYLPEIPPVYPDMSVDEYLHFVAELKGVKKAEIKPMLADIKERIKISHVSGKLIKNLSKGYRQRVGLAQALVGYPEVLILDEPTVGLDPKQIIEIRDFIKELGKNHTIILSSHILSEVSAVCDHVMIINRGVLVASDTPDRLSESLSQNRFRARIKGEREAVVSAFKVNENIVSVTENETNEDGTVDLVIEGNKDRDTREDIFDTAVSNGFKLLLLKSEKLSLEEVFLQVTEMDAADMPDEAQGEQQDSDTPDFEIDEDESNSETEENTEVTEETASDENTETSEDETADTEDTTDTAAAETNADEDSDEIKSNENEKERE